ncbi:uroporphyrinogen-III synthase [Paludibaculum fermentans]|uniref:uroporphyrinogen-III synthase n=1 Tax=Paludibaculum fermentans TaxID=1473598 RepID=UPI003EBEE40E
MYGANQPLHGQRVVVTRARSQAGSLSARLRALGADVLELPVIDFVPLEFSAPDFKSYDWAIFTSVNGVEFFFDKVKPESGPKLCAIGSATAEALRQRGLEPSVVPDEYLAESVVAALSAEGLEGRSILLPRASVGRDVIPEELTKLGARVDVLPVYKTIVPPELAQQAQALLLAAKPNWITLTSSSTVKNLLAAAGPELVSASKIASIGPVTSEVARRHGLTVTVEAVPSTIEALLEAMQSWMAQHEPAPKPASA